MTRTPIHSRSSTRASRGFTLLELLIVVAVIALLIGLIVSVGAAVISGRSTTVTQNILFSLDRALDEYRNEVGAFPRYSTGDYDETPGKSYSETDFVQYRGSRHPERPDASVFVRQSQGVGVVDSIISGLPAQFLMTTENVYSTAPGEVPSGGRVTVEPEDNDEDLSPSIIDSWGIPREEWITIPSSNSEPWPIARQQLIYYVHPDNPLAQDLFGQCVNRRPYFVSAGPDRAYGFRNETDPQEAGESIDEYRERVHSLLDDNIYSYGVGDFNQSEDFFDDFRTSDAE